MGAHNEAVVQNPFIVNGRTVDIHITSRGSDWFFAVMAIMGVTTITIIGTSYLRPRTHRLFHHILAMVALTAMIEYFSMASNLGWVPIDVEFQRSSIRVAGINRQIWWVRYIGWFITWPLISLALCLTATVPLLNIIWTCFLTVVMVAMALGGALVRSEYKWGYYAFWLACWFGLIVNLLFTTRRYAFARGTDVHNVFMGTSAWVLFLWMLYPICWGCSEGGNVISPNSEFVFYGILDCCLIPVTSAALLFGHRNIDPKRLGVVMRDIDDPVYGYTSPRDEKAGNIHHGDATGATTGEDIMTPATQPVVPTAV